MIFRKLDFLKIDKCLDFGQKVPAHASVVGKTKDLVKGSAPREFPLRKLQEEMAVSSRFPSFPNPSFVATPYATVLGTFALVDTFEM